MGDVRGKFLRPLLTVFSLPKSDDVEAFVNAYVASLERFPDFVLDAAATRIIQTRTMRVLPLPAEAIAACREIKNEASEPDLAKQPEDKYEVWSEQRQKNADRLLASPIGAQAAREGWQWGLWDFMREAGHWPNKFEAERIKARSLARQAETRDYLSEQEQAGGIKPETKELLANMRRTYDRFKDIALAGSVK